MPTPIIATFYSFRGGVGRTMALLNAGWVLARTGSRVLLIDFDLEAPGLTRLIARQDLFAGAAESVPGMADIIVQLLDTPEQWAFHADKPLPIDLSPFLRELKLPDPKFDWLPRGRLALISAGADKDYERHLARMHTGQFTRLHEGFAARFREALLKSGQFDYILIDARTGFSDEAYIACRYLCDRLVVLSGLNDQNIEGTGRFLSKVAAWSEKEPSPRNIILIASPVPEHEEELKAARFAQAKARLAELSGAKPDFALQLPYHPRVSLYEELIAERFPDGGLGRAYQQLADMLRGAAQDSYRDWAQRATEAIGRDDMDAALAAARRAAALGPTQAASLFLQVGSAARRSDCCDDGRTAFGQALAIFRATDDRGAIASALLNLADLDFLQGRYSDARRGYGESLVISRELSDKSGIWASVRGLARLNARHGSYSEARRDYEESLAIARELDDRRLTSTTLRSLAVLDQLQGRYSDARRGYGEALAIARELGDPGVINSTLYRLAALDQFQGRYSDARRGYGETLPIARRTGKRREIGMELLSLAELDRLVGRVAEGRRGLEEALAIQRELGNPREIAFAELYLEAARAQEDAGSDLAALRAAVRAARECPDPFVAARSYQRFGVVLRQRGELAEARNEFSAGIEFADGHGLRGIAAEMRVERALAAADAGEAAHATADARAALAFFDAESVAHPQVARLRELAALPDTPHP